jgi:acyl-coenzyme A thioesterase PaaI-like protein
VTGYLPDEITAEERARQQQLYGPFAQAVRELVDAAIRTTVDEDEIRRAQTEVEQIVARLRKSQMNGSFGTRINPVDGTARAWGNAVVGLRNAVAPPLHIVREEGGDGGRVHCEFHLGAAYEGPPTLVHGGVSALILDQMLGEAASAGGKPGMTGTLTLRYRQGTPLGDLRAEAWIDRVEGIKTWAKGHIIGPSGITVEAEGVFILPRWAREAMAEHPELPRVTSFE